MLKLTNELDNFIILNPKYIVSFEICSLQDGNLGLEFYLENGRRIKVQECLKDIRKMFFDLGINISSREN